MDRKTSGKKNAHRSSQNMKLPENMNEDLKVMNKKINDIAVKSLESTRRMLVSCSEGKEAGIKTLVMLDDQGEQIEKMEENLNTINQDMKEADVQLQEMEKCCGLCILPWNKTKNSNKGTAWKKDCNINRISDQPIRITVGETIKGSTGGYITRITNDSVEDEMDENVMQVAQMMGNFKSMAIDIGIEIDHQKEQLDRIKIEMDADRDRIEGANYRTIKIITKV